MAKERPLGYLIVPHYFPLSHGLLILPWSSSDHQFLFLDNEIVNGLIEKGKLDLHLSSDIFNH